MNDKYKLTDNFIEKFGKKLYQIQAIKSFGGVKKDEIGGYVENEKNLSASGSAWVSGSAQVSG